jgi:hypothetical protein
MSEVFAVFGFNPNRSTLPVISRKIKVLSLQNG